MVRNCKSQQLQWCHLELGLTEISQMKEDDHVNQLNYFEGHHLIDCCCLTNYWWENELLKVWIRKSWTKSSKIGPSPIICPIIEQLMCHEKRFHESRNRNRMKWISNLPELTESAFSLISPAVSWAFKCFRRELGWV